MSELGQIERESRAAAITRHNLERSISADGETARAWNLATTAAAAGRIDRPWFSVMYAGDDAATVWLKNEIGCNGVTAKHLLEALQNCKTIELFINSNGGDSACALELFRGLQGRATEAAIIEKCFSAAVTVAMSAKKIRLEKSARMMIHKPRLFRYGVSDELRQSAEYLDRITGEICEILAVRTKQSAASVNKWFFGDTYFSASDAIEVGLADELWECQPPPSDMLTSGGGVNLNADKTPEEKEFWRMLDSFEVLPVKNRERFFDNLARVLFYKVKSA